MTSCVLSSADSLSSSVQFSEAYLCGIHFKNWPFLCFNLLLPKFPYYMCYLQESGMKEGALKGYLTMTHKSSWRNWNSRNRRPRFETYESLSRKDQFTNVLYLCCSTVSILNCKQDLYAIMINQKKLQNLSFFLVLMNLRSASIQLSHLHVKQIKLSQKLIGIGWMSPVLLPFYATQSL